MFIVRVVQQYVNKKSKPSWQTEWSDLNHFHYRNVRETSLNSTLIRLSRRLLCSSIHCCMFCILQWCQDSIFLDCDACLCHSKKTGLYKNINKETFLDKAAALKMIRCLLFKQTSSLRIYWNSQFVKSIQKWLSIKLGEGQTMSKISDIETSEPMKTMIVKASMCYWPVRWSEFASLLTHTSIEYRKEGNEIPEPVWKLLVSDSIEEGFGDLLVCSFFFW